MTTADLTARLTALAESLDYQAPAAEVRDGVVYLTCAARDFMGRERRSLVGGVPLGLAREGWRRLSAELRRVAAAE